MPASRFTKKANTPRRQRMWQHVYDSAKKRGGGSGSAIRQANAAVKRDTRGCPRCG